MRTTRRAANDDGGRVVGDDREWSDDAVEARFVGAQRFVIVERAVAELRDGRDVLIAGGRASGRTRTLREVVRQLPEAAAWITRQRRSVAPSESSGRAAAVVIDDLDLVPVDAACGIPRSAVVAASTSAHSNAVSATRRAFAQLGRGEPRILTLDDLERDAVSALARDDVGPLDDATLDALVATAGGRPGDVLAVVRASHAAGFLTPRRGRLHVIGPWRLDGVVSDVVDRVAALEHCDRSLVELVALAGALDDVVVAQLGRQEVADRLVADGLLARADDDARPAFTVARPVDGELLVRGLEPRSRRAHLATLVDMVVPGDPDHAHRYAQWALELGRGDATVLVDVAWMAYRRGDFAFAESCATLVLDADARAEARVVRGACRARLGQFSAALHDLAVAVDSTDADTRGHAADVAAGLGLLHRAADGVGADRADSDRAARLRAHAHPATVRAQGAVHAVFRGDVAAAHAELRRVRSSPSSTGNELASIAHSALAVVELDATHIGHARARASHVADAARALSIGADAADAHEVQLAVLSGERVDRLRRRAEVGLRRGRATLDTFAQFAWTGACAIVSLASGALTEAVAATEHALTGARTWAHEIVVPGALARDVWVRLQAGWLEAAHAGLDELDHVAPEDPRVAACHALEGALVSPYDGAELASAQVSNALRVGHLAAAVELAAIPLRVGISTSSTVAAIDAIRRHRRTPRLDLLAAHAIGLRDGDPVGLDAVSRRYARAGWRLAAVDATLHAVCAGLDEARGRRRAAALLATCPGAWSPSAVALKRPRLTPREREVGGGAIAGRTNAEIADALALSPRTVETYLSRIYRTLGVRNRRELTIYHAPWFATTQYLQR